MMNLKKILASAALAVTVMGGMAAVTATPASARVVCDRWHCWHTRGYYDPYYDSDYYGPGYYGPGVTLGFGFGGGHGHWHGGGGHFHGGGGFHGGSHGGGGHHH